MGLTLLPRNGRYEIFTHRNRTHCFDDPTFVAMDTPAGMFDWIREQDSDLWHGLKDGSNTAFYLKPELYILFKLKWT